MTSIARNGIRRQRRAPGGDFGGRLNLTRSFLPHVAITPNGEAPWTVSMARG
jgi:hypothetical protein